MYRFLLAALLTASAMYADAVTFTSCTAGTNVVSPCPGTYSFPGGLTNQAIAGAEASDHAVGPGIVSASPFTGQTLTAAAIAVAYESISESVSAIADASAGNTYSTGGATGPGYIQFYVQLDHSHGGGANVDFTDGVHTYSFNLNGGSTTPTYCNIDGCAFTGVVPFELGVDFTVDASANVTENLSSGAGGFVAHGSDDAVLAFNILGSDQSTPVAFYAVPEPSILGLLLAGGALLLAAVGRRSKLSVCERISTR